MQMSAAFKRQSGFSLGCRCAVVGVYLSGCRILQHRIGKADCPRIPSKWVGIVLQGACFCLKGICLSLLPLVKLVGRHDFYGLGMGACVPFFGCHLLGWFYCVGSGRSHAYHICLLRLKSYKITE